MVSLLTFRVEIAPDLDVLWDEERPPTLLFILEDDEHDRLLAAGGLEHWEYADAPIAPLIDFLFGKRPRDRGKGWFACEYSRPAMGRVRMRVSYRGRQILEREYDEDVCHVAIRLCGHAKAFNELCGAVARDRSRGFREDLDALIKGNDRASTRERPVPGPMRVEPKPRQTRLAPLHRGFTQALVRTPILPPVTEDRPRHESSPETPKPVLTVLIRPSAKVPKGPLRSTQVRLFAADLARGMTLPTSLSPEAKEQVVAYAKAAGLPGTTDAN